MAGHHSSPPERDRLDLFRAIPGYVAPRDAQDVMAYPFFSLAKTHRLTPIVFDGGGVSIRVEADVDRGMATIWDADILIWAASQIVEARDAGFSTSRLMVATPYEILKFIGRGTSVRDYQRLSAALDRLQSTWVTTSIRNQTKGQFHRFSWLQKWRHRRDANGRPDGIEMILPEWFYQAVLDDALVLTIDRAYFNLTGGLERWLYRLVRKHGGKQRHGWHFDLRHLHLKSGSLSPFKRFTFELRDIIRRQPLPGYELFIEVEASGRVLLSFERLRACGKPVDSFVPSGTGCRVQSGTRLTCHPEPKPGVTHRSNSEIQPLNLESNIESNFVEGAAAGEKPIFGGKIGANDSAGKEANGRHFGSDGTSAGDPAELPELPFDGAASGQLP